MPEPDITLPKRIPKRRQHFTKVIKAREHIESQSLKIAKTLTQRAIQGDARTAKWLLEHTSATDDAGQEQRPLGVGVDSRGGNALGTVAPSGPSIVINMPLGADFARLNTQPTDRPSLTLPQSVPVLDAIATIIE